MLQRIELKFVRSDFDRYEVYYRTVEKPKGFFSRLFGYHPWEPIKAYMRVPEGRNPDTYYLIGPYTNYSVTIGEINHTRKKFRNLNDIERYYNEQEYEYSRDRARYAEWMAEHPREIR